MADVMSITGLLNIIKRTYWQIVAIASSAHCGYYPNLCFHTLCGKSTVSERNYAMLLYTNFGFCLLQTCWTHSRRNFSQVKGLNVSILILYTYVLIFIGCNMVTVSVFCRNICIQHFIEQVETEGGMLLIPRPLFILCLSQCITSSTLQQSNRDVQTSSFKVTQHAA